MPRSVRSRFRAGLVALLAAQAATPAGSAAQDQQPTFRTGINIVRVDVVVTDREGAPVTDLSAADFEIREDGKVQTIDTFRTVPLDGGRRESAGTPPLGISSTDIEADEASRDDVRVFALLLDDFHVSKDWNAAVREQLTRFVQSLGPTDMVGLMTPVTAIGSMRLTRDHAAIIREIQKFDGRRDDAEGPTNLELRRPEYRAPRPVPVARVTASLKALKDLISRLGDLKEGRKTLILLTQGLSATYARDLKEIAELANRKNVAIYPVDPQIRPPQMQWRENNTVGTMLRLAQDTGGREITDQAKTIGEFRERRPFDQAPRSMLAASLRQIIQDASSYYLLTYASSQGSDDKFHDIDVRVNRRDVQVHSRRGYWAMGEDALARAAAAKPMARPTLVENALAAAPVDTSPFIRTWVGMSRGDEGRTRVTFVWEPLSRTPGSLRDAENAAAVSVTALGPDGVEYFSGSGPRVDFDVPPATPVQLRLTIESARGTVLETDVRRVTADEFAADRIQLGTARVYRARTARELNTLRTDPGAVPDAARDFARAEQLLIRVPVYAPDGVAPAVSAQLQNRAGRVLAHLPVTRPADPASSADATVPLASLPAGEYAVRFVAAGSGGEATEIVVFRVVN